MSNQVLTKNSKFAIINKQKIKNYKNKEKNKNKMLSLFKKFFEMTSLPLVSMVALLLGMMSGSWIGQGSLNILTTEKPNPLYYCDFCQTQRQTSQELASILGGFFDSFKALFKKQLNSSPAFAANEVLPFDTDQDGLTNRMELFLGTDPFNRDTDGDGYLDGTELKNGYSPLIAFSAL